MAGNSSSKTNGARIDNSSRSAGCSSRRRGDEIRREAGDWQSMAFMLVRSMKRNSEAGAKKVEGLVAGARGCGDDVLLGNHLKAIVPTGSAIGQRCCNDRTMANNSFLTSGLRSRQVGASRAFVWGWFLCIVPFLISGCHSVADKGREEAFSEDLLIRPLSDGKVLNHFYFKNYLHTLGSAAHNHVFPKAISQLVRKFHISELELSFTQGRWNYERWGALDPVGSSNAKPSGVELWAEFDVPSDQVDPTWRNLTHALSGLFCASINFLESPAVVAAPSLVFGSRINKGASKEGHTANVRKSGVVRYGALPREAVCTENLTPWLKLLPCRDKAGIATLLDRPSVYKGYYHSLRVHVGRSQPGGAVILEQTLTLVLQPAQLRERGSKELPNWSLTSLFARKLEGRCPLAKSSHVLLELERPLVLSVERLAASKSEPAELSDEKSQQGRRNDKGRQVDVADNPAFHMSPYPDRVFVESQGSGDISQASSLMLDYDLQNHSSARPLNLAMLWKERVYWSSLRGPFRVSRFLIGSGNEKGSLAIELKRNFDLPVQDEVVAANDVEVTIFQVVAWYVRLYLHTLTARVDGNQVPLQNIITQMLVTPAEDRLSPAVLEVKLKLPRNVSIMSLTMDFDKEAGSVHVYTDNLLVPLATPDFSMPYNVITFTCTVLALYFGSLLNTLRRRIGEEERLAKRASGGKLKESISRFMEGKSATQKKLIKVSGVILIAGIAVAFNYALEYYQVL
ncbi:hypothetical protein AXG93_3507s1270 [Marchantia polymorpha subsp. ruderalis]|uniref:GPI transamidase component PIG-T n=1 Tax=Marchantia polymorpha subsp. ruderalis TaxID=1480154 RepID=A0A176VH64_MARPO|nr:hypothetical protein AXG93_3507s1270 [Marchantia polymorpha subsp. ruderalis]